MAILDVKSRRGMLQGPAVETSLSVYARQTRSSSPIPSFSELSVQHDVFKIGVVEIGRRSGKLIH
jgi:hypothetical protein